MEKTAANFGSPPLVSVVGRKVERVRIMFVGKKIRTCLNAKFLFYHMVGTRDNFNFKTTIMASVCRVYMLVCGDFGFQINRASGVV